MTPNLPEKVAAIWSPSGQCRCALPAEARWAFQTAPNTGERFERPTDFPCSSACLIITRKCLNKRVFRRSSGFQPPWRWLRLVARAKKVLLRAPATRSPSGAVSAPRTLEILWMASKLLECATRSHSPGLLCFAGLWQCAHLPTPNLLPSLLGSQIPLSNWSKSSATWIGRRWRREPICRQPVRR